jgi:patatin-like phospholipase/acyl hydrolase
MRLFCSPFPNPDGYHDLDVLMSDVALASSAVPVIFPIHQINEHRFVDGGVFANAPDIVALQKAIFHLDVPMEKIKMCSIGTMTGRFFLDNQIHNDAGIISWGRNKRLPTLMMSAQQQFTTSFMRDILQERYLRIDTLTSDPDVEIFSYQKKDLDKICNLAKNSWNALDKEKLFKEILG